MATKLDGKPARALWKLLRDDAFASLRDDFTARVAECSLSMSQGKLVRELQQPQSQRELARRLHVAPQTVRTWVSRKHPGPIPYYVDLLIEVWLKEAR